MFGYFLKTPFVRSYINLVKGSCLEILLKIAGFSQLCKVSVIRSCLELFS